MPSVNHAFDLPPRLSGKADARLIGADEQHFAAIAATLAEQVRRLSDDLAELRRAPAGRGRGALDRDLEIHRLSARLRLLRRYGLDACLGRLSFADGSAEAYVGRLGLTDAAGRHLLVDWRTPAAEPFFAATQAHPQGVTVRRRYRWSAGRVTDYHDEVLDPGELRTPVAPDDDSALLADLAASRSPRMRDVLATIAADQDAVIRAGSRGALVVDGGPGTGKTVVALHRAAYLTYADPRLGAGRGGVLVVGPHERYLAYVSDVLPSLGEEGVRTCTMRELVPEGAEAVDEADPEVARLKASGRLVEAVEPAVALFEEPPTQTLLVETYWADLPVAAADWTEAFAAVDAGTPHNEARDQVWEALLEILLDRRPDDVEPDTLRRALETHAELHRAFSRAWPILEPTDLVADLWAVPAYLRRCAPWLDADQRRALKRPEGSPWTAADLPLLDAMRSRLGDPGASARNRRRRAQEAADRAYMDDVVQRILEADDDPESGLKLLNRGSIRDSLVHDDVFEDLAADPLAGPFGHVIVDEAQELTDAEWQLLLRRCPSRSFTVVGDRAQARRGFTESWADRLNRVGFTDVRVARLSINYRTPVQVMAAAEPVLHAILPDAELPTSIRSDGREVLRISRAELPALLTRWLATEDGIGCLIGVPAPTEVAPSERLAGLTPTTAKGLEFDLVVLLEPDGWGGGLETAVDTYVAMTRATQQLVIVQG